MSGISFIRTTRPCRSHVFSSFLHWILLRGFRTVPFLRWPAKVIRTMPPSLDEILLAKGNTLEQDRRLSFPPFFVVISAFPTFFFLFYFLSSFWCCDEEDPSDDAVAVSNSPAFDTAKWDPRVHGNVSSICFVKRRIFRYLWFYSSRDTPIDFIARVSLLLSEGIHWTGKLFRQLS